MWYFRMANGTKYFLAGKEARKSGRVRVPVRKSDWHTILPGNTLCTGEEIPQELILIAEFHIDDTIAQARSTSSFKDLVDASHCFLGILEGLEFNIAVHGFSRRALHDNMDRATFIGANEAGLPPKKLDNFLLRDGVWDLISLQSAPVIYYTEIKASRDLGSRILTFAILTTPHFCGRWK